MIIIGTEKEIEAMIKEVCPHMAKHNVSCDGYCQACWNKAASIVIVRPELIGRAEKDIDGISFLERLKEGGTADET